MKKIILSFLLPFLISVYPSLFHYANNVEIVRINSLGRMIVFNSFLAVVIYLVILVFNKKRAHNSAVAAFVFLVFFNTYGLLINALMHQGRNIRHAFFLPFFILFAIFITWITSKIKNELSINLWSILTTIFILLSAINIIRIVPAEMKKNDRQTSTVNQTPLLQHHDNDDPDIYYLVFDEFAGFEAIRQYWKNTQVDDFVNTLSNLGFFVAEESYTTGRTGDSLHQMAMRLNYQVFSHQIEYRDTLFRAIENNRVMEYLKRKGYTTITFDDVRGPFGYETMKPIQADINFEDDPEIIKINYLFDEYGTLVADNTMLLAFSRYYKAFNPALIRHKNMIHFTTDKLGELHGNGPIFVYVHLLFPHPPFMFDEHGRVIDQVFHEDWDYYLGNYMYSVHIIQKMVDNILSGTDPEKPPVIILQSDHGARIEPDNGPKNKYGDYPEELAALILNAVYLPHCEEAPLTHTMDPINTFPIIFNCIFDDNIPIQHIPIDYFPLQQ